MAGNEQFSRNTNLVQAPLASGGTDPFATAVDMSGYDGVRFLGILGTAGSTDVCTFAAYGAASSTSTSTSDGYTLLSTAATMSSSAGEDDKLFDINVFRPRSRWVTSKITCSAAIEYGGSITQRYGRIAESSTRGSTTLVAAAVHVVPQTTG